MYCITKWCKIITDDHKDHYTHRLEHMKKRLEAEEGSVPPLYSFRLLDDDGDIYAYGKGTNNSSFAPLDYYMYDYGVTEIQWKDPITGKYETL